MAAISSRDIDFARYASPLRPDELLVRGLIISNDSDLKYTAVAAIPRTRTTSCVRRDDVGAPPSLLFRIVELLNYILKVRYMYHRYSINAMCITYTLSVANIFHDYRIYIMYTREYIRRMEVDVVMESYSPLLDPRVAWRRTVGRDPGPRSGG